MGTKNERVFISWSIEATPINHATCMRARMNIIHMAMHMASYVHGIIATKL